MIFVQIKLYEQSIAQTLPMGLFVNGVRMDLTGATFNIFDMLSSGKGFISQ